MALTAYQKKKKEVTKHGKGMFGSLKEFNQWLNAPAFSLGGKKYIGHMRSIKGLEEVDRILTLLERGDAAGI